MYIPFRKEELGGKPEDEDIVIKEYHRFIKSLNQNKTIPELTVTDYESFRKATMNNELVIDKHLTLKLSITDSGCSLQRKELYLKQEELMMQPSDIEEEELSSPAKVLEQDATVAAIGPLKTLPQEQLDTMKELNWSYLHKIFPELNA